MIGAQDVDIDAQLAICDARSASVAPDRSPYVATLLLPCNHYKNCPNPCNAMLGMPVAVSPVSCSANRAESGRPIPSSEVAAGVSEVIIVLAILPPTIP